MAWKKGQSGNPKGKPPGPTARGKFREQVDAALPEIVANLIAAAQGGDMQATQMILARVIPPLKPTSDPAKIPMPKSGSLADQGERIVAAAVAGALSPDEAKALIEVLTAQAKLVEQSELEIRLDEIEAAIKAMPAK